MKKCPVCGSTRFTEGIAGKKCQRCGYTWQRKPKLKLFEVFRSVDNDD